MSLLARLVPGSAWVLDGGGPFQFCDALTGVTVGASERLVANGLDYSGGEAIDDRGVGTWDGTQWTRLGKPDGGVAGSVHALARYDDGTGEALYAGGDFVGAGLFFEGMNHISRLDGAGWDFVGTGLSHPVHALHVIDLGAGDVLAVGGAFTAADGGPAAHVATWNGTSYAALGDGVDGTVRALAIWQGDLAVGGDFTHAGTNDANRVATWDGTAWSPLGDGLDGPVYALAVYDDGSGAKLYAGGEFDNAGGAPAHGIACWDDTAWSALPGPFTADFVPRVHALAVSDVLTGAGSQPLLVVGGNFTSVAGLESEGVAWWDGVQWSNPYGSIQGGVFALHVEADELAFGGSFVAADTTASSNVALLSDPCLAADTGPFCFGTDADCPCGNGGASDTGCDIAQATGGVRLDALAFEPDGLGGGRATLVGTGFPPAATPTLVTIRSTEFVLPPVAFGDGLRCVGLGNLTRVGAAFAIDGVATRTLQHGAPSGTYYYQLWLRNQPAMFCSPEAFNLSNAYELTW